MTANANVLTDMRHSYKDLTLSQKRIAELIVEDPEFVAFATVEKLALRLGVSPSTVVRFAYRVGLSGYPELQQKVRDVVRTQMRPSPSGDGKGVRRLGTSVRVQSRSLSFMTVRICEPPLRAFLSATSITP